MSRTPVRDALFRLRAKATSGRAEVGWSVRPFDFDQLEKLYDLRLILELATVTRLCARRRRARARGAQGDLARPAGRAARATPSEVGALDEAFHTTLVAAAGNPEMARVHWEVTERIRIVRRLDFTQADRIDTTYDEHAKILRAVIHRRADQALRLLRTHIEPSKAEVRKITLHSSTRPRAIGRSRCARRA